MTKPKKPWQCQRCGCLGKTIPRATPRSLICAWCVRDLTRQGLVWCSATRHGVTPDCMATPTWCRDCRSAASRAWRDAHPGYTAEKNRAWQAAHSEHMSAYRKAYYQQNRERILVKKQAYYQQNRERIIAYQRFRRMRGLITPASRERERQRQQEKRAIYKANERYNRATRLLRILRGAA